MSQTPEILLLSLAGRECSNDEMYSHMIFDLADRSYLRGVNSVCGATKYLDRITPKAIIVTDEGLTESKHEAVLDRIREYVKNGGMVIMAAFFPSFTPVDSFNKFFNQSFGLTWRAGDNLVSTDELNPICILPVGATKHSFPASYTSKAVHIRDAQPHEIIMRPVPGAQTQSLVSSAGPGGESQAAVVGAKIGDGYLAYIGDVHSEKKTVQVVIALCGLPHRVESDIWGYYNY